MAENGFGRDRRRSALTSGDPMRPSSETAMVVAPQPEAAESGLDLLRAGGNAVDAAVGAALVQTVVEASASR